MTAADFTPERIAELRLTGEGLGGDVEIAWVMMLDAIEGLQAELKVVKAKEWQRVMDRSRPYPS